MFSNLCLELDHVVLEGLFYLCNALDWMVFVYTHAEVGAFLCESWDFPENLIGAIRNHHRIEMAEAEDRISQCLFVGNALANHLFRSTNAPPSATESDMPQAVFDVFGTDFDTILGGIEGLQTDLDQATSMLQIGMQS